MVAQLIISLRMPHAEHYLFRAEWTSAVQKLRTYNWESNDEANLGYILETAIEFILKLAIEEAIVRVVL